MGLVCRLSGHRWDGCKCSRCGETRDEQHDWDGSACKRCGRKLSAADISGLSNQSHIVGIALDPREAVEVRVAAIKHVRDQTVLLDILYGDSRKNVIGIDVFKEAALTVLHDEEMLRGFAETSTDYPMCYKAYRQLDVIPRDFSVIGLMDVVRQLRGANKSGLIDYIIDEHLGITVGCVRVTSEDIQALALAKDVRTLTRLVNSRSPGGWHELARDGLRAMCDEAGGHHFNHSHICEVCSVKECGVTGVHYLDEHCSCSACGQSWHTGLNTSKDGSVCERCKGMVVTEYGSYYDGVPGYGTEVVLSANFILYPDGTKEHVRDL